MVGKVKRILIGIAITVVALTILLSVYLLYIYHSVEQTAVQIYEDPNRPTYISKDPEVTRPLSLQVPIHESKPFTVLVLGVDERKNDRGRSDTMIVMSINPQQESILMFNIPRDTRTDIIGHGTIDKINHAYAFGNIPMSIQTVESFLDYPIDYYIKVNMEGFARIIDLLGGVEVENPFEFDYEGHVFKQGLQALNGSEALLYSRMRYDDPNGDMGRNERQREILTQLMDSALNLTNITKINKLLNEANSSVKTNITFDQMRQFLTQYRPHLKHIETNEIHGSGKIIDGIWYYIIDQKERDRIHYLLKSHMQ